jgi:hypothetical protein
LKLVSTRHIAETNLYYSSSFALWWLTGAHAVREEAERVKLAAAFLEMGLAGLSIISAWHDPPAAAP